MYFQVEECERDIAAIIHMDSSSKIHICWCRISNCPQDFNSVIFRAIYLPFKRLITYVVIDDKICFLYLIFRKSITKTMLYVFHKYRSNFFFRIRVLIHLP